MTPTAVAVVIMLLTCAQLVFVLDFCFSTLVLDCCMYHISCAFNNSITTMTTVTMLTIYVESM